jgi:hypothetical protein
MVVYLLVLIKAGKTRLGAAHNFDGCRTLANMRAVLLHDAFVY